MQETVNIESPFGSRYNSIGPEETAVLICIKLFSFNPVLIRVLSHGWHVLAIILVAEHDDRDCECVVSLYRGGCFCKERAVDKVNTVVLQLQLLEKDWQSTQVHG